MFDFSWSEILLIGVVALVFIGPKDLPKALRTAGIVIRRVRGLAREFQNSLDEVIREAELEESRKHFAPAPPFDADQTIGRPPEPEEQRDLFDHEPAIAADAESTFHPESSPPDPVAGPPVDPHPVPPPP